MSRRDGSVLMLNGRLSRLTVLQMEAWVEEAKAKSKAS